MTATILFGDGSEIESDGLTAAQRQMIEDGLPAVAIIPPAERKEAWKGKKLTKPRDLKAPKKDEDPTTKQLRKELAAAEEQKKAERFARLQELKAETKKAKMAATQETTMKTKTAKKTTSKAAQVAGLRAKRAATKGPKADEKAVAKKAATAKARTPAAPKPASGGPKVIRPGSKLEIVVGLLTRKEGCTAAEVLAATEWPAVSMPQQAKAAGLTLRKEKDGKASRYWGTNA